MIWFFISAFIGSVSGFLVSFFSFRSAIKKKGAGSLSCCSCCSLRSYS